MRYGLAMVDSSTARGAADSTRTQIAEFELVGDEAPYVGTREVGTRPAATFSGEVAPDRFPYPALVQDSRTLFETTGPVD